MRTPLPLHKEKTMKEARTIHQTVSDEDLRSVMQRIADGISQILPVKAEVQNDIDGLEIHWSIEQAWAIGGSIEVTSRRHRSSDGDLHWIKVEVNASSSYRSPAQAVAFARCYQEIAEAACLAEAIHCGMLYRFDESEEAYLAASRKRLDRAAAREKA
jgi:hypothetical protein